MYWRYSGYVLLYKASTVGARTQTQLWKYAHFNTHSHRDRRNLFEEWKHGYQGQGSVSWPTDGITQGKVVALGGEDGEEASLAEATVRGGHDQGEHAHGDKHAQFGEEDAPEEGPDDVTEVEQHHVLEQEGGEGEHGHKVAQPFGLGTGD